MQDVKTKLIDEVTIANGLIPIRDDSTGLYGYFDMKGNIAIPCIYGEGYSFSEGRALVQDAETGLYGYIDSSGKVAVPLMYSSDSVSKTGFRDGRTPVRDEATGLYGYIDENGAWAIEPIYPDAKDFSEGLAAVEYPGEPIQPGKIWYGYIAPDGTQTLNFSYQTARPFSDGLAYVRGGFDSTIKNGYMDKAGNLVIDLSKSFYTSEFGDFSEGLAKLTTTTGGNYIRIGYLDKKGGVAIENRFQSAQDFHNGYALVTDMEAGTTGFLSPDGLVHVPATATGGAYYKPSVVFSNGFYPANYIDVYGEGAIFLDKKFERVNPQGTHYYYISSASEDGYVFAQRHDYQQNKVVYDIVKVASYEDFSHRLAGTDRYDTMSKVVNNGFTADEVDTVIIARGTDFPDALAASGLAGILNAPVITTMDGELTEASRHTIENLAPSKAYVLGGPTSISPKAFDDVCSIVPDVERINGDDRIETADLIYAKSDQWGRTAIVTTAFYYSDALSASPLAYAENMPVFLADADGNLSERSKAALSGGGFDEVLLLGGINRVSEQTETDLKIQLGDSSVKRYAGEDRCRTSAMIAQAAAERGSLFFSDVTVATAWDFPAALAAGPASGNQGGIVLLAGDTSLDLLESTIRANKTTITSATLLGTNSSLSADVERAVNRAMGL